MPSFRPTFDRRRLVLGSTAAVLPASIRAQTTTPSPTIVPPSLAGSAIRLLTWQRPIDGFTNAYETLLRTWADSNGVGLTIDWMPPDAMIDAVMNEVSLGYGHDLIDTPRPMPQAEPAMRNLGALHDELVGKYGEPVPVCAGSTLNPVTGVRHGIASGWEPSIAIYRASLWQEAGYPFGPRTTDELLSGATWIWDERGAQAGLGLTPTWSAEVAAQMLVWAAGGAVQDAEEQVVLASDGSRAAVDWMRRLYLGASTPVVLLWNEGDHVEFMLNGFGSYTLGGVNDLRQIATRNPELAADLSIAPPIGGSAATQPARSMALTIPALMIPAWNATPEPAEQMIREIIGQSAAIAMASQLVYVPAFSATMPGLTDLLGNDPFDGTMPTRLAPLVGASSWTVSAGWPGPNNPMIEAGHRAGLLVSMLADTATESVPDGDAITLTADAFELLAEPWRASGLMRPQSTEDGVG